MQTFHLRFHQPKSYLAQKNLIKKIIQLEILRKKEKNREKKKKFIIMKCI